MKTINFQIAYGAVKHFGRNLYTSNPPAIAELVANSWDAYSENCYIYNNENDNSLLILDDGIGMNDEELINRYAISGTEKNTSLIRKPHSLKERPYMGRKGIGKFSSFSLGESYNIYTKSDEDTEWKKIVLRYDELLVNEATVSREVEYIANLDELKTKFGISYDLTHGTAIYIPKMRRKFIKSSQDSLEKILARRFSINILDSFAFSLILNGKTIDLSKHFYDQHLEFVYYFGYAEKDIKKRFPHLKNEALFAKEIPFFSINRVSGWIGTVKSPKDLWVSEDQTTYGVVVYINGKLADENILKHKLDARISNSYAVGEVSANFLQNESEDPVLSSREGLNYEIKNVKSLENELFKMKTELISNWNSLRASRNANEQDYLEDILHTTHYSNQYYSLNPTDRNKFNKYSQKLFDNSETISKGEKNFYIPFLFSIVNSEAIKEIKIDSEDSMDAILAKFYQLFDKTDVNYALRIKSNIEDRLTIIKKLESSIDNEAIEKVFEEHLAKHPWLINAFWDRAKDNISVTRQVKFNKLVEGSSKIDGISDILVQVGEEPYPIICELKREKKTSYSSPDIQGIISQISRYRKSISDILIHDQIPIHSRNNIIAYFICGDHVLTKFAPIDRTELENNNIQLLSYQQMIEKARRIYCSALDDIEE